MPELIRGNLAAQPYRINLDIDGDTLEGMDTIKHRMRKLGVTDSMADRAQVIAYAVAITLAVTEAQITEMTEELAKHGQQQQQPGKADGSGDSATTGSPIADDSGAEGASVCFSL